MSAERNTEIWSTRLQRELLALTTDNAPDDTKEEVIATLPSFITIKSHELDIAKGDCFVSFQVDIALPPKDGAESGHANIVVTLDASLIKKPDGAVDPIAVAYPFLKPGAVLTSGSSFLPPGSTIKDGDAIDIEMDWTPSLHLTDAVLNIGLKLKESILQGEPFFPRRNTEKDPVEEMVSKARRLGTSFSRSLRGLAEKATEPQGPRSKDGKKSGSRSNRKGKKQDPKREITPAGEVRIGDEINMLEAPWVDCQGVYSCKAIRRPVFVEDAMAVAAQQLQETSGNTDQVANAGFAGAGAMFRSFTQSARSVLEESFLMITDTHIIEMRSNKLNLSTGVVTFAIPIDMMAKLKFRRQESISLFFKPAPDDPLIYMCPDSADAVHQIQAVLKRHGVKGKHTNAATHRAINQALHLVQEIQTKELALKHDPSVDRVNEIMDLYRQAAERFEVAGDVRHEEVVTHMRKFLALPLTVSILDGSYQKPADDHEPRLSISQKSSPNAVPEGVVLERADHHIDDEDNEADTSMRSTPAKVDRPRSNSADKAFEENMDSILKEAEADLANLKMEDDPELDGILDTDGAGSGEAGGSGSADDIDIEDSAIADFENMLKEADNELAELMKS